MENLTQSVTTNITPKQFMEFFHGIDSNGEDLLNQLSLEDRLAIFSQIMLGSSDFTKELLDSIFSDYGVYNLEIFDLDDNLFIK